MRLNQDYKLRIIAGQYYLISVDRAAGVDPVIQLTETAAWICVQIDSGIPSEGISQKMTQEYDIDLSHARAAVNQFLSELRRQGVLIQE